MNTVETDHVDAELRLGIGSHHTGSHRSAADHWQPINIFYNCRFCTCDATEIQARIIIYLAKKEMEEYHREKRLTLSPVAIVAAPQLLNPKLTLKHSLQRFLQKRKARISASAPYHQVPPRQSTLSNTTQIPLHQYSPEPN